MKLACSIILVKPRSSNTRPSKATLTIFRELKTKPIKLRISSTTVPKLDVSLGDGNLAGVISKRIEQGMATLTFIDPSVHVMISQADPVQLSAFLKILKAASSDENIPALPNAISSSQQANSNTPKPGPTSLEIGQRRDYPFWTPIPATLTTLQVKNCRLTEFDNRILKLKHLTRLVLNGNDFSNGRLDKISLRSLAHLTQLDLSQNDIDHLSDQFIRQLPSKLGYLYLRSNKLASLPEILFQNNDFALRLLDLADNQLTQLCKKMDKKVRANLRNFSINRNQLTTLPTWIGLLKLDNIDISGNPFLDMAVTAGGRTTTAEALEMEMEPFPSLMEMSAACIAHNRIPSSWLPPSLQHYVQHVSTLQCDVCGQMSLQSRAKIKHYSLDLRRVSAVVTTHTQGNGRYATLEGVCCSERCSKIFSSGKCFR